MSGASMNTLIRRLVYGGRKARSAERRLRAQGERVVLVGLNDGRVGAIVVNLKWGKEYWMGSP